MRQLSLKTQCVFWLSVLRGTQHCEGNATVGGLVWLAGRLLSVDI